MGLPNQKCVWEQCQAGNVVRAVSRQELLREAGLGDCEGMSRSTMLMVALGAPTPGPGRMFQNVRGRRGV